MVCESSAASMVLVTVTVMILSTFVSNEILATLSRVIKNPVTNATVDKSIKDWQCLYYYCTQATVRTRFWYDSNVP